MYKIKKFEILVGLPGAGKTTYAHKRKAEDPNVLIFDVDSYEDTSVSNLVKYLKELNVENENTVCVIDGLFLNESTQRIFYNEMDNYLFVYFTPDTNKCLINDNHRLQSGERSLSARKTIQKSRVDDPSRFAKNVITLETVTPFFDDAILSSLKNTPWINSDGEVQCSDTWVLEGSTYGTCWDEDGPSEPTWNDEEPSDKKDFTAFFEFMTALTNETNKDKILNVYGHFIEQGSDSESDYYGGCEYRGYWYFNPKYIIKEFMKSEFNIYVNDTETIKNSHPEIYLRYLL